ncbi:Serine/threonine-protein kinase 16 [Armadillidium nasatum]|uniref:non-specific serine/threonine protein kinase n=1 Tax=Armadillidium nasatum TaxID=96803 RepID=A0A5N5SLA4_9CRUS|nr:Serine/threonine-protein kinase 16 [Armadillidium nasatum]
MDEAIVLENILEKEVFSTVDLVEDLITHKLYALKKIICHSPEDQKIALTEVDYYKLFDSQHIIECIDSDYVGIPNMTSNSTSQILILLPYCKRGTLHHELMSRMKAGVHMEEKVVLKIFRHICEGVRVMHSTAPYPLVHRDLKTSNILLKDDMLPLIMDLGSMTKARVEITSSREARKLQDEAAERSSMPYRAPELFNVESTGSVDERTDIWSLGCLLYAMCFYKSPFDSVYERGDSVALAVVGGKIPFPEAHPYSEDMVDLITSMIQVNPEERPYIDWVIESVEQLMKKMSGVV